MPKYPAGQAGPITLPPIVEIDHVSHYIDGRPILADICWRISAESIGPCWDPTVPARRRC